MRTNKLPDLSEFHQSGFKPTACKIIRGPRLALDEVRYDRWVVRPGAKYNSYLRKVGNEGLVMIYYLPSKGWRVAFCEDGALSKGRVPGPGSKRAKKTWTIIDRVFGGHNEAMLWAKHQSW